LRAYEEDEQGESSPEELLLECNLMFHKNGGFVSDRFWNRHVLLEVRQRINLGFPYLLIGLLNLRHNGHERLKVVKNFDCIKVAPESSECESEAVPHKEKLARSFRSSNKNKQKSDQAKLHDRIGGVFIW
jgi:hypothetical protein